MADKHKFEVYMSAAFVAVFLFLPPCIYISNTYFIKQIELNFLSLLQIQCPCYMKQPSEQACIKCDSISPFLLPIVSSK